MIINPIIPIWLMSIICIVLIILIIFDKQFNNNFFKKQNIEKNVKIRKVKNINIILKLISVVLLFIINLRFMIPNGEASAVTSNTSVLFVIDTTVSMKALDYNGNKERFEGVINDCCYIVDELPTCKFSIITFGDTAQRLIPYTTDTDMVQAELKAISLENNYFAKGSSMNIVKDIMEETLRKEYEKNDDDSNLVVFFISDGEITTEKNLETFTEIKKYVNNGAVLGYGTQDGGKMINNGDEDEPDNPYSYIYYYDDNDKYVQAISKIDENNLKQIAQDIELDYIHMEKTSNIDYKLNDIKQQYSNSQTDEKKFSTYKDIYYYFTILLVILLIIDFIIKKRRMQ